MYESLGGRFNSEFGLEALPHVNTIEYFAPDAADRHPHSLVLDFHNKAEGQDRRIAGYLADNFRVVASFEVCFCLNRSSERLTYYRRMFIARKLPRQTPWRTHTADGVGNGVMVVNAAAPSSGSSMTAGRARRGPLSTTFCARNRPIIPLPVPLSRSRSASVASTATGRIHMLARQRPTTCRTSSG